MRIVKLHEPTGHPYWQAGEYRVQLPDGTFLDTEGMEANFLGGHYIEVHEDGIYFQQCGSSSGLGKIPLSRYPPVLIVPRSDYDEVQFVGEKNEMSDKLKNEIRDLGLS